MSLRFSSSALFCGALLVLVGLTGCRDSDSAQVEQLRHQLRLLENQIAVEQASLDQAVARHERAQAEEEIVAYIRGGFHSELVWSASGPTVTGKVRNDSSFPISSIGVKVTRNQGPNVIDRELVTIRFSTILMPGTETTFSAEASPFIWGFQEQQVPGFYTLLVEEAVLANGQTVRDDFSAARRREFELTRKREALLETRLQHGTVYQKLAEFER